MEKVYKIVNLFRKLTRNYWEDVYNIYYLFNFSFFFS